MKRRKLLAGMVALSTLPLSACLRDPYQVAFPYGRPADHLEADVATTLARLHTVVPDFKRLLSGAAGVLVFPSIVVLDPSVGDLIPARGGRGALQVANVTVGYYRLRWIPDDQAIAAERAPRSLTCIFSQLDALNGFRVRDVTTLDQLAEGGAVIVLEGMDGTTSAAPLAGRAEIIRATY